MWTFEFMLHIYPADTLHNNDAVITSNTSFWRNYVKTTSFDVITTSLLRHLFSGYMQHPFLICLNQWGVFDIFTFWYLLIVIFTSQSTPIFWPNSKDKPVVLREITVSLLKDEELDEGAVHMMEFKIDVSSKVIHMMTVWEAFPIPDAS